MPYCYSYDKSVCKLYERAYGKVHDKLSGTYVSKSEMQVLLKEFYDLKSLIMERLLLIEIIQNDLSSSKEMNERFSDSACSTTYYSNIGDSSTLYSSDYEETMRGHILAAMDEWNQMDRLYKREAGQSKSRVSADDLEVHYVLLMEIRDHIHSINDENRTGIPNTLGVDLDTKEKESSKKTPQSKQKDQPDSAVSKKDKILGQQPKKTHSKIPVAPPAEKYDRKPIDDKIKRMEEKIAHLKKVAVEKAEVANAQNDIIKENLTDSGNIGGDFMINEENRKLIAMNNALAFQAEETKRQNAETTKYQLDAASKRLGEYVELL